VRRRRTARCCAVLCCAGCVVVAGAAARGREGAPRAAGGVTHAWRRHAQTLFSRSTASVVARVISHCSFASGASACPLSRLRGRRLRAPVAAPCGRHDAGAQGRRACGCATASCSIFCARRRRALRRRAACVALRARARWTCARASAARRRPGGGAQRQQRAQRRRCGDGHTSQRCRCSATPPAAASSAACGGPRRAPFSRARALLLRRLAPPQAVCRGAAERRVCRCEC
jgi:hypothetical protein